MLRTTCSRQSTLRCSSDTIGDVILNRFRLLLDSTYNSRMVRRSSILNCTLGGRRFDTRNRRVRVRTNDTAVLILASLRWYWPTRCSRSSSSFFWRSTAHNLTVELSCKAPKLPLSTTPIKSFCQLNITYNKYTEPLFAF